ncbi:MAG: glycosyltransferase family 4 protein [Clostridia bacterium]|nr:glycosyltransferase family 4 protein [Clostridia bacterium]
MSELKNIIIVNDINYINGGAAKVAINTAKAFENDEKINVYFFSSVDKNTNKENEKIHYITTNQEESLHDKNKIRGAINGIWNIKAKRDFGKLLKKFDKNDTIIHIHSWSKALSSSVFYIANKKGFKIIVTLHDYFSLCPNGGLYNYTKQEICNINPMSYKCIKCNCDSRNYMFKVYRIVRQFVQNKLVKMNQKIKYVVSISDFSIKQMRINLQPNTIIKRVYNPIQTNKENKINNIEKNDYYLYVGRLSKEKGVELFCKAITNLHEKGIVIGDGEQLEILKKDYPQIDFLGWKKSEQVIEYMKNARALIFPSLWYECAPLTILEALSIGLPCIVSDECAAVEFIKEGITGVNFKRNSAEDLKDKIKLFRDNEYLKRLNTSAYEIYWNNPFDISRYKKDLREFYNEVLNSEKE